MGIQPGSKRRHLDAGEAITGKDIAYLSLFDIFTRFPDLRADVDFSLITDRTLWHTSFGWLGPAGTVTAWHIDWIDNVLAQIHGRKEVALVAPRHRAAMYPSTKFDYRTTISRVDPTRAEDWPRYATVRPLVCVLEPGDALYIPRGWWHRVRALDASISVNTFGHDLLGLGWHQSIASLQRWLHRRGLYRRAECTCHHTVDGHWRPITP